MAIQKQNGVVQLPLRFLVVVGVVIWALGSLLLQPAPAMTGYHIVRASNPVHVYFGASPLTGYSRSIAPGSELNIRCQDYGAIAASTNIWDQLSDGGWILNLYASTESVTGFSPYLARCPASSPNREFTALSRAAARVGQIRMPDGQYWSGHCDHLMAVLFGQKNSGYATAIANWNALNWMGMTHPHDANPPFGAMVFFNSGGPGHVVFSLGDGTVISTPVHDGEPIFRVALSYFGLTNLKGWSYAQPSWQS